jgi:hypothetical protein
MPIGEEVENITIQKADMRRRGKYNKAQNR